MPDDSEPRRSVRATKGQHKSLDSLDQPAEAPAKKGRGKKGTSKKVESQEPTSNAEDEEIIRCICGAVEQDDDSDEKWIQCEKCDAWQHNICMGVTIDEKELETLDYFCEECKPEDHKETLAAIAKGEKPWEVRQKAYEDSLVQTKGKKKKGKAASKRESDPKLEVAEKVTSAKPPSTPAESKKPKKDVVVRAGSAKRKDRDESADEPAKSKVRKVSTQEGAPQSSTPSDIPANISLLLAKRQPAAKFILKNLTVAMKNAKKSGVFKGSDPELDAKAMRLTLEIERAAFDTHPDGNAYNDQCRKLAANLKINQELCDGLLQKTLTPSAFAVMTSDEMASKDLQKQTAEMKARAEKQSIMVSDDGPRIRRTHKGDEIIEDGAAPLGEDMPAMNRRSMLDPNGEMAVRSRDASPGDGGDELPQDIDDYRSNDNIRAAVAPTGPLSLNTQGGSPPPPRKQSVPNNFDINKIYSSVQQSPTSPTHARKQSMQLPPKDGPGEDPEIDKMLEDGNESPPYSPAEFDPDPTIVWRGQLQMNSIASFAAVGRHIGGADLSVLPDDPISFEDLIPQKLSVAGRIEQDKATEYLCSLRYSPPTDIVILSLSPSGEAAQEEFQKLYDYFTTKNKWGVIGNKSFANVRDTYLIPVPPGNGPGPEFMLNLEDNYLPKDRPEPMILITLVIRHAMNPDGSIRTGPPTPMAQRQMSASAPGGPSLSPLNSTNSFIPDIEESVGEGPQPPQARVRYTAFNTPMHMMTKEQHAERAAKYDKQRKGEITATQILGELVNSPTVGFILPQAFMMQPAEWRVIKEILVADEQARRDLPHLSKLLEQRSEFSASGS